MSVKVSSYLILWYVYLIGRAKNNNKGNKIIEIGFVFFKLHLYKKLYTSSTDNVIILYPCVSVERQATHTHILKKYIFPHALKESKHVYSVS